MDDFKLSIIIPSYNEMANLQKGTLEKVKNYLSKKKYSYEVLVVDDGSNDGSREFVVNFAKENKGFRVIENNHTGKAGAVTTGMLKAKGDYVLFTDMDQATPIEEVEKLLPYMRGNFDIVIGSRKDHREGAPFSRKVMAKGMIITRTILVGLSKIDDTQCGFKIFKKEASDKIFSKINKIHGGFKSTKINSSVSAGFDVEILYIGQKLGYSIKEVPVKWLYVETRRVNPVRDSFEALSELMRIRTNIIKGIY